MDDYNVKIYLTIHSCRCCLQFPSSSAFYRLAGPLQVTLALDILYAFPGSDGALAQTCLQVGTFGKQTDMDWVLEEKDKSK